MTTGKGETTATSRNNGIPLSTMTVGNPKLCAYYFKHMERVQRRPIAKTIKLFFVQS
jgi:hypothetical protein